MTVKTVKPESLEGGYISALKRLKEAETKEQLDRLSESFDRIYKAGFLTPDQLVKLDNKIIDKLIMLEEGAEYPGAGNSPG